MQLVLQIYLILPVFSFTFNKYRKYLTAESTVKFIADELGSNYDWKDINFEQATEDDM